MIPPSCAWALRTGLRRITSSTPMRIPRTTISGTSSSPLTAIHAPAHLRPAAPLPRILRRYNASKPSPVAQTSPATTKTIPGPGWLWLEPIYEPFRAYGRVQQRRPYMTQFVSALVIYFVGDIVAQSIGGPPVEQKDAEVEAGEGQEEDVEKGWVQEWSENRDWGRTGRALIIGGAAAVPGYRWFLWLGEAFNYKSKILSLTTKVVVNQILFTPIFNSYFFGMQSLLSGATLPEIAERIKHTVPVSWINSCKIWPAVTAFSFTFIPIQYRSIFGGVIAIGWQTYLSMLNQRAAKLEEVEHALEHEHVGHDTQTKSKRGVSCGAREGDEEKCAA